MAKEIRTDAMNVLFVCAADLRGPSEKQVLGFAQELGSMGHRVMLLMRELAAEPEEDEHLPNVEIAAYRFVGPCLNLASRRHVKMFRPSVIHVFSPRLRPIAVARRINRLVSAPVAVHFEDDEWGMRAGYPSDSPRRRVLRRAACALAPVFPEIWPYVTDGSLRWVQRNAAGVDALTPELAREVERRLGRRCETILPTLPASLTRVTSQTIELPARLQDRQIIVYTGGVFGPHEEDFRLLLRATALLDRRGERAALLYAGLTANRFDLLQMALEEGLDPSRVHSLGYVPSRVLPRVLQTGTVLVQPGRPTAFNRLRLPSKLQAYLASGVPTVTFACGFGELLKDREEVLKTYGGEPGELADRIQEVLNDSSLGRRLGVGGRQAARRLFDPITTTQALLAYYRGLVSSRE